MKKFFMKTISILRKMAFWLEAIRDRIGKDIYNYFLIKITISNIIWLEVKRMKKMKEIDPRIIITILLAGILVQTIVFILISSIGNYLDTIMLVMIGISIVLIIIAIISFVIDTIKNPDKYKK